MTDEPSANGANGRDAAGRFVEGNVGGPGNPYAKQVARVRSAMLGAVTADDLRAICAKLVEQAKAGSIPAAKEVLDRCLGRSLSLSDLSKWVEWSEHDAKRAEEDAQHEESNRPEILAQAIADGSGIDPNAILRFVAPKPEHQQTQLAVRLARKTGTNYDELATFLNGHLDEMHAARTGEHDHDEHPG